MGGRDLNVPVAGGVIAVRDHGGQGRDVLMLPPPAFTLEGWSRVVDELDGRLRVVSVDLRGHAQSTADLEGSDGVLDDLGAVVEATGLTAPIVVGQDLSGTYLVATVAREPERYGAVVLLDSPALATTAQAREVLDLLGQPEVWADVAHRAAFGFRTDAARLDAAVDELTQRFAQEWLVGDYDPDLLREGVRRGFYDEGDGSFVRRPSEPFMRWLVAPGPAWIESGCREGVDALPLPVWVIRPDEGAYNHFVAGFGEGESPYPRELRGVSGGSRAATTHPREVAAVLLELAETLPA